MLRCLLVARKEYLTGVLTGLTGRSKNFDPTGLYLWSGLQQSIRNYFSKFAVNTFGWAVNSFGINETSNLYTEEEQLIDLRNNLFFQALLSRKSLDEFWLLFTYPIQ